MANRATEGEGDGNGHLVTLVFALVAALPTRNWYNEVTAPPSPKLGHYVGHVRIAKYSDLVARASRPLSRERPARVGARAGCPRPSGQDARATNDFVDARCNPEERAVLFRITSLPARWPLPRQAPSPAKENRGAEPYRQISFTYLSTTNYKYITRLKRDPNSMSSHVPGTLSSSLPRKKRVPPFSQTPELDLYQPPRWILVRNIRFPS